MFSVHPADIRCNDGHKTVAEAAIDLDFDCESVNSVDRCRTNP